MSFIIDQQNTITLNQLFNQQHASIILQQKLSQKPHFDTIILHNVGVKIMKDVFDKFSQHDIKNVKLLYDWNQIMMMPKLVCYDKNTWKTLQQLANWNRQWSLIFRSCLAIQRVEIQIGCTWADQQFVKAFLEGIAALPNIKQVNITIRCKNNKVGQILTAFKQAKIFPVLNSQFIQIN